MYSRQNGVLLHPYFGRLLLQLLKDDSTIGPHLQVMESGSQGAGPVTEDD